MSRLPVGAVSLSSKHLVGKHTHPSLLRRRTIQGRPATMHGTYNMDPAPSLVIPCSRMRSRIPKSYFWRTMLLLIEQINITSHHHPLLYQEATECIVPPRGGTHLLPASDFSAKNNRSSAIVNGKTPYFETFLTTVSTCLQTGRLHFMKMLKY